MNQQQLADLSSQLVAKFNNQGLLGVALDDLVATVGCNPEDVALFVTNTRHVPLFNACQAVKLSCTGGTFVYAMTVTEAVQKLGLDALGPMRGTNRPVVTFIGPHAYINVVAINRGS